MQNAGGFAAALGSEAPLPGCGELGVPARRAAPRESCCPGATGASARLGAGRTVPTRPWVLPTGRTSVLWASALSHAALCSGRGGRMGEPELNSFPSSATVLFPRVSQSPRGPSSVPLGSPRCLSPFSHPPGYSEQAHPHMGHPAQPGRAPRQPRRPPRVHSRWQGVRGTQLSIPPGRLSRSLIPERSREGRTVAYLQKPAEKHPGLRSVSQGHVWKQGSP